MAKTGDRKLTVKQEMFCQEYIANGGNATEAYRIAYNSSAKPETASPEACRLLKTPKVSARVEQLKDEEAARVRKKYQLDNDRVAKEYVRLAYADVRKLFNDDGTIKNPKDLDDDTAAAIGGIEVDYKADGTPKIKVKLLDKRQPLQDVAKMLGMFKEDNEQRKPLFELPDDELEKIAKG